MVAGGEFGEHAAGGWEVAGGVQGVDEVGEGGFKDLAGGGVGGVEGVELAEAEVELFEVGGAGFWERAAGGLAVAVGVVKDLEVVGAERDAQVVGDLHGRVGGEAAAGDAQAVDAAEVVELDAGVVELEARVLGGDVGVGEPELVAGLAADPHRAGREAVVGGDAGAAVGDADLEAGLWHRSGRGPW